MWKPSDLVEPGTCSIIIAPQFSEIYLKVQGETANVHPKSSTNCRVPSHRTLDSVDLLSITLKNICKDFKGFLTWNLTMNIEGNLMLSKLHMDQFNFPHVFFAFNFEKCPYR